MIFEGIKRNNISMDGLYRRARSILRKDQLLKIIHKKDADSEVLSDIPKGESEEILSQIDRAVSQEKQLINGNAFTFKSKKKDFSFPLFINISAIIIIIGGVFLFFYFFGREEESIISEAGRIISAEGRLIAKLKEETRAQIDQKEQEISETRLKLLEMENERNKLETEMEQRIGEREAELRNLLEEELEKERNLLISEGKSEEEVQRIILELENEKEQEFSLRLSDFREESMRQLQEKSADLEDLAREYEQMLSRQEQEERELREKLLAEEAARTSEAERQMTALSEDFLGLQKQQETRQLVLAQIQFSYRDIQNDLNTGNYSGALEGLDSLENYLTQEAGKSDPFIQERVPVEMFIIDSLRKLVADKDNSADAERENLLKTAAELTEVSGLVEQGDDLFQKGETDKAAELYVSALNKIPSLRQSYTRLQEINDLSIQQRRDELTALLRSGDSLYASGRYRESLDSYQDALEVLREESLDVNQLIAKISEAGYRIGDAEDTSRMNLAAAEAVENGDQLFAAGDFGRAIAVYSAAIQDYPESMWLQSALEGMQKAFETLILKLEGDIAEAEKQLIAVQEAEMRRAEIEEAEVREAAVQRGIPDDSKLKERLGIIQGLYSGYTEFTEGSAQRSQEEFYSLLQAKILMKRILNSEEIKTDHPELYDRVEQYYQAYGEEKQREGSYSTMRDIIAFLDILLNPERYSEEEVNRTAAELALRQDLFTDFLDKLSSLME